MECETDTFNNLSLPPASSPPLSPAPPPFSVPITPQRDQEGGSCFSCGRPGHWARQCPNKIAKKSHPSSSSLTQNDAASEFPLIRCPCGRGICRIRTSNTAKNPNRKFYTCPDRNSGFCNFFKWCDQLRIRAPMCPCGAGVCSLTRESAGPNQGKWYFSCRIRKNHGACHFFEWADSEVNSIMKKYAGENKVQSSNAADNILGMKKVISEVELAVTGNAENSLNLTITVVPENSLDLREEELHNRMTGKALQVFHPNPLYKSRSHCLKKLWRQIFSSENTITEDIIYQILGLHVFGWLGRLAFTPSRCLKDPPVMPIFCYIHPSFEPATAVEDVDEHGIKGPLFLEHNASDAETDMPSSQTPKPDAELLSGVFQEPSGINNASGRIQEERDISKSILKTFGQALLTSLESMNPLQHEAMVKVAEATFTTLQNLSIECGPFSEGVKEFINNASTLASIEESVCKGFSSQNELVNNKKVQYENISRLHNEALTAYKASNDRLQSLHEEVSQVKSRLLQLEKQLFSYEADTAALKIHVDEVSEEMFESKKSLDAASLGMVEAQKLEHKRETVLDAAKAALKNARVWLEL